MRGKFSKIMLAMLVSLNLGLTTTFSNLAKAGEVITYPGNGVLGTVTVG